jgi:uncharacterized protein YkwD
MRSAATIAVSLCALTVLVFTQDADAFSVKRFTAPQSVCPGQTDRGAAIAAQEQTMRCMITYARRKAGRGRLSDSGKLDRSAQNKARDILRCQDFSHVACGRNFLYWFEQLDYLLSGCWRAGENIAWGSGPRGDPRSIMRSWLRSPPHRANMLSRGFDQLGVGLQDGTLGGYSNAGIWVTHFGNHC